MSGWLAWLVKGRSLELGCALALGYAMSLVAKNIAEVPALALAQQIEEDADVLDLLNLFSSGLYLLNFEIASTVFFYGDVLASALALALVVLVTLVVVKRRDRVLGTCPYCASLIPHESRHCAYCGSGIEPGEP